MRIFLSLLLCVACMFSGAVYSKSPESGPEVQNLDQLLQKVRDRQQREAEINRKREAEFLAARNKQKALLRNAEKEFLAAQKINNPLKKITDANNEQIKKLQKDLDDSIQQLGDIYSIYYEFSGDLTAVLEESMVHAQLPARAEALKVLGNRDELPSIEDMESFWILVQEEMTEAAKITQFTSTVLDSEGQMQTQPVARVGTFSAVSNGKLLRYIPETGELLTLTRQPRERNIAADFEKSLQGGAVATPTPMIIDPTRGALLGVLVQSPTLLERIQQGKLVGYIILAIGSLGLLITLWRFLFLLKNWLSTKRQLGRIGSPQANNPLGRVISSVSGLGKIDEETLQFKLDEAILQEIPRLERGHGLIKLLAAVAPLLGLLGTVIGMIATFQAIAIFGSGDPKLMAGGISQALVTTVLGLVVAIPLLFGHNLVSALSRSIIQVLDEQSAGLLARHLENRGKGN